MIFFKLKHIVLLSVIMCTLSSCTNDYDTSSTSYGNTSNESKDDSRHCIIISQDFVKKNLQYPSEADFATLQSICEDEGDGKYIVLGKFSAKNAYNVESQYMYKIWMSHNGEDWTDINNWRYSKLILEDEHKKQTIVDNRVKPKNNTTKRILGVVDGIECVFIEGNETFTRITTSSKKMTTTQMEKAIRELNIKTCVVHFCLQGKTSRGDEYGGKSGDFVAVYDE